MIGFIHLQIAEPKFSLQSPLGWLETHTVFPGQFPKQIKRQPVHIRPKEDDCNKTHKIIQILSVKRLVGHFLGIFLTVLHNPKFDLV